MSETTSNKKVPAKKVADKNIEVIAITDHDTVDGLEEGEFEAKKYGITFVRGIELNIERPNCECHLLGLGLQEISPELKKIISSLQKSRNERNEQMISLMNAGGIEITMEDLQNEFSCQPNQSHTNAGKSRFYEQRKEFIWNKPN